MQMRRARVLLGVLILLMGIFALVFYMDKPANELTVASIQSQTSTPLIITEIMFNPASAEDDWEWIEIYNASASPIDLAGYVVDDNNGVAHLAANIASGSVPANGAAILYNVDDVSAADFEAAWGTGINLIAVSNWAAMGLNNSGDTIGLWDSFASYSGDNATQANVITQAVYAGTLDDGAGSIYLTDLANDTTNTGSWALSTDGLDSPVGVAYTSALAGSNSGADVGSPQGTLEQVGLVFSEIMNNPASAEDNWEWVELYNLSSNPVDLTGYVIDDFNSVAHTAANIAGGTVPANGAAILYNADDVSAADFEAAWGTGINLIPVTNWGAMALNNSGETLGLWDSFASYDGDNQTLVNAIARAVIPGDLDNGTGSLFLTNLENDPTDIASWSLSIEGVTSPVGVAYTSLAAGGNSGADVGSPQGILPSPLVFTELMSNPASAEDNWEWIEIYNTSSSTVDISGYVVDDNNGSSHPSANIASGSIPGNGTAILYNADDVSAADFEAAWGTGINLIPVTNWGAMALNNGGDVVGLWDSFASYSGDNVAQVNVIARAVYGSTSNGFSLYLNNLANDPTDAANWLNSTDGGVTPVGVGYASVAAAGNVGNEIGSPQGTFSDNPPQIASTIPADNGTLFPTGTITVSFTESVDVSNSAPVIVLDCPSYAGTPQTLTTALTDVTSLLFDPALDPTSGEICGVTIVATQITDRDTVADQLDGDTDGIGGDNYTFTVNIGTPVVSNCDLSNGATHCIHEVQGNPTTYTPDDFTGFLQESPLHAQIVTVTAIVVGDHQESGEFDGFFIQEEDTDTDADPTSSEGVFVFCGSGSFACPNVALGDKVTVTGEVDEFFNMTQLEPASSANVIVHSSGNPLPSPAVLTMPVAVVDDLTLAADPREAFEGMRVTVPNAMTVVEYFNFDRFGEIVVSSAGRFYQYTALNAPSTAGYDDFFDYVIANTLVIDDGRNTQNVTPKYYPTNAFNTGSLNIANSFRGGDSVSGITGILNYSFDEWRVQVLDQVPTPQAADGTPLPLALTFTPNNPRPSAPVVGGDITVASYNVLNYFTTLGSRGAANAGDFARQKTKIIAGICALNADVVGLNEIENNGFGPGSAIQDLVTGLNAACGGRNYAFVDPGIGLIGTDAITVGVLYDTNTVQIAPGTSAVVLSDANLPAGFVAPIFDGVNTNRNPIAVTFKVIEASTSQNGQFTVVVNHFKSKGGTGTGADADIGDGQGNWNARRTQASNAILAWLASNPTGTSDGDYLVIGDLNAYTLEDPITAFTTAGYTNLIAAYGGPTAYSYVFDGQLGYLDHALSNPSMTAQVVGVAEWHVNADEPDILDYITTFGNDPTWYEPNVYRASDHDPLIVGLLLNVENEAPIAVDDTDFPLDEDTALNVPAPGVLFNDTDADSPNLTALLETNASNGTVVLNGDGSFSYTPNQDFFGDDSFTYTASDGNLQSNVATVFLTVNPVNDAPVAVDDTDFSVDEDLVLNVAAPGVLVNDSDIDNATLTATVVTNPSNGTVFLNSDGSFSYTPNQDFFGDDSFTYTASDGSLPSNVATVFITVNPVNDAPVAVDDTDFFVDEDLVLNVAAPGVLVNDSDVDNAILTATVVTSPSNGMVFLNSDGSFSYTPNQDFFGDDSFTYTASDGSLPSNVATVFVTVNPVNDAPVATEDNLTTDEDTQLALAAILTNDTDVDFDALSIVVETVPTNGIITDVAGALYYVPNANFFGSDSFTYRASDGSLQSDVATVLITVNPVNDPPVAVNDPGYAVDEDTVLTVDALAGVLANDSDIDSVNLTVTVNTTTSNGLLVLNTDGSFTYTPNQNFNGSDSFTYLLSDNNGGTAIGTATIVVNPVNDPPALVIAAPSITVNEGDAASNTGSITDVDGDIVTLSATLGTAINNNNGTFSWSFLTTDGPAQSTVVTLTADDGKGGVVSASFSLTVNNVQPTVQIVDGAGIAVESITISPADNFALTAIFTDPSPVDTHTATIDWGDGSAIEAGSVDAVLRQVSGIHRYRGVGVRFLTVCVIDKDGAQGCDTITINVEGGPPTDPGQPGPPGNNRGNGNNG